MCASKEILVKAGDPSPWVGCWIATAKGGVMVQESQGAPLAAGASTLGCESWLGHRVTLAAFSLLGQLLSSHP